MEIDLYNKLKVEVKNRPLLKNIAILSGGTLLAQIVSVASSPIIARIFNPEDFGYLGSFISIVLILVSFSTFAFAQAIVLPKKKIIANYLVYISYISAILISSITFIILFFLDNYIAVWLHIETIKNYLIYIPLFLLVGAAIQINEQILIREQKFKIISKITILQTLLINGLKIILGYLHPTIFVLVASTIIAQTYKSIKMVTSIESIKFIKLNNLSIFKMKYVLNKFKDFPKYRAPQQFFSAISHGLPILLLTYFFSPIIAGYFILADRIIKIPISILSQSVSKVYLKHISDMVNNNQNVYHILKKSTITLGLIGLIPTIIILFFGPELFSFVFGESWYKAGIFSQLLIFSLFISFMTTPSIQYLTVSGNQKYILYWEILTTLVKIIIIMSMSILYKIPEYTILIYSIVGAAAYFLLIMKAFNELNKINRIV